jgi:rRNA maturation RNase YbeY
VSVVSFFNEDISFELLDDAKSQGWILNAIAGEGKSAGEINYIFCSDSYLHKMNLDHLSHDTFTDIITFNYCVDDVVSSDIFISIERVRENAEIYNVSFENELSRVMIHGVLHLLGYDDKTELERQVMRAKEDFYLTLQ